LAAEFRILTHLLKGAGRYPDDTERLRRFYAPQAEHYDRFRDRLLHGRHEMISYLAPKPGDRLVELGAGTGRNLEFFDEPTLRQMGAVTLVDLGAPLLDIARRRAARWSNVQVVEADAALYRPAAPVDRVYFAYSLSMITDWRAAIDNAAAMLRPGGLIGAVDFYVSARQGGPGRKQHGWPTRFFWPHWFAHDGVRLGPEQLEYLLSRFEIVRLREHRGSVPYIPRLRVPYYIFTGRKPG
jgi:S-adenosylmethionine-diacylgycerolhomoserine-N-methlytransferase